VCVGVWGGGFGCVYLYHGYSYKLECSAQCSRESSLVHCRAYCSGNLPTTRVVLRSCETSQRVRKKIKEGESLGPFCTWCNYISFDVTHMQITNVQLLMKAFADDWNDGQKFFHTLCSFSATAQPWYCMRHQNPPPCKTGKKKLRIQLAPAHDQDVLFCSMCVSNPQQSFESRHQLVFLVISGETLSSDEWRSKTTGENKIVSCPVKARCNVQSAALVIPYMLQGTRNCGMFQPAVVQT